MSATAREFKDYLNSFYGNDGVYPMRNVTLHETREAIEHIEKMGHTFEGDSFDRELARDFLFTEDEMRAGYSDAEKRSLVVYA